MTSLSEFLQNYEEVTRGGKRIYFSGWGRWANCGRKAQFLRWMEQKYPMQESLREVVIKT